MHELDRWKEERNSAWLYRVMSDQESGTASQLLFLELAEEADNQAALWEIEIRKAGGKLPEHYRPGRWIGTVSWLIRNVGAQHIKPLLSAMKIRGLSVYSGHRMAGHGLAASEEQAGASHVRKVASASVRAAALGINDGLISITLLIMGIAGATAESATILLTGIAGLLAGACSMAAGEWISMRSQREMNEYRTRLERDGLAQFPVEEAAELALIYQARGMSREEAVTLARKRIADQGLDSLARKGPGANPDERLSPQLAAMSSFFAFISGGLIPLLPFLLEARRHPLLTAGILSGVAMFAIGAALSHLTGRGALWGGIRTLLIGTAAAAIAYFAGGLLGAKIS